MYLYRKDELHRTFPLGYESFTFSKTGSCFIQQLCETIRAEGATLHLIAILNKVDMKLRKRFVEKSTTPYQALYIENWSFNKLMFLSSHAVRYYKAAWKTLGAKKSESKYEKPPASRPLLVNKEELKRALAGVKTAANNYQDDILEPVVRPLNDTLFAGSHWVFQQDSAPADKARSTQQWLQKNIPEFISASDWPSGSPDLNPLN
ncbi:unnamed protein product [Nezara viridula]|uniref:Caspase family p10 domain-containing protein n=1 Tax=Nezara viridula TaxID=85310 RepID=A0A9P0MVX8_NEZVI|nr:unnamed protein product [Nezara viridula]